MAPSTPARWASLAMSAASGVVYSAIPASTGTRPFTTSTAASSSATFSAFDRDLISPTVPAMMRPDTPSRSRPSMTLRVASRSMLKSARNWVVTAGKTPFQLTADLPMTFSLDNAAYSVCILYILFAVKPRKIPGCASPCRMDLATAGQQSRLLAGHRRGGLIHFKFPKVFQQSLTQRRVQFEDNRSIWPKSQLQQDILTKGIPDRSYLRDRRSKDCAGRVVARHDALADRKSTRLN